MPKNTLGKRLSIHDNMTEELMKNNPFEHYSYVKLKQNRIVRQPLIE